MSEYYDPNDDLDGVGSLVHQNSLGSSGIENDPNDQLATRASSRNDVHNHDGDVGIIPTNSMAIVPTHHNMDVKLFESIVVCIPQKFHR
jgi:hypothetical protein